MKHATDRRRGTSIVEMSIASSVLVVILGAGGHVLLSGQRTFSRGTVESTLRVEATRLLDSLAVEIAEGGLVTASIGAPNADGGPYLTFQQCVGVDAANVIVWGPPVVLGYVNKDPLSGNAFASGGGVALTTGAETQVLGTNVAANGLQITIDGGVVTMTLALERAITGQGTARVVAVRRARFEN